MSNNPFESPGAKPQFTNEVKHPDATAKMPGLLLTFAIIGICLGSWSLLGGCCGAGLMVMQDAFVDLIASSDKNAAEIMEKSMEVQKKYIVYTIFSLAVSLILGGLLVFGSIAVLKKAPFGLTLLSNTYLIYAIIMIISIGMTVFIQIQTAEAMQEVFKDMPARLRQQNEQSQFISLIVGVVFSVIFTVLYFLGWFFLRSRKIRDWYAQFAQA